MSGGIRCGHAGPLIGPLGIGNGNGNAVRAPFDLQLAAVKAVRCAATEDDVSRHEWGLFWSAAMRKEIIGGGGRPSDRDPLLDKRTGSPTGREGGRNHYEGIVRCCGDFRLTHD